MNKFIVGRRHAISYRTAPQHDTVKPSTETDGVFEASGPGRRTPVHLFGGSDVTFSTIVDGMVYFTVLARTDLDGELNYTDRNVVEKFFQAYTMRIEYFHEPWKNGRLSAERWLAAHTHYYPLPTRRIFEYVRCDTRSEVGGPSSLPLNHSNPYSKTSTERTSWKPRFKWPGRRRLPTSCRRSGQPPI